MKASFRDPDAVDVEVESEKGKEKDFDQLDEENEDDVTVIYITPAPLLHTLSKPTVTESLSTTTPSATTVSESDSSESQTPVPDYPINDHIPGILDLGGLVIPHRLRHDGSHKEPKTTPESIEGSGKLDQGDDEDYSIDEDKKDSRISTEPEKAKSEVLQKPSEEEEKETLIVSKILQGSQEANETDTETTEEPKTSKSSRIPMGPFMDEYEEDDYSFDNSTFLNETDTFEGIFLDSNEVEDNGKYISSIISNFNKFEFDIFRYFRPDSERGLPC